MNSNPLNMNDLWHLLHLHQTILFSAFLPTIKFLRFSLFSPRLSHLFQDSRFFCNLLSVYIFVSLHISVSLCPTYVYICLRIFNQYLAYMRQDSGDDDYDDDNGDEIAPLILIQWHCSRRLRCQWLGIYSFFTVFVLISIRCFECEFSLRFNVAKRNDWNE